MFLFSLSTFQLLHWQTANYHLFFGAEKNNLVLSEMSMQSTLLVLSFWKVSVKDVHIHATEAMPVFPWDGRTIRRVEVGTCAAQSQKAAGRNFWSPRRMKSAAFLSGREHEGTTTSNQKLAPGTTLISKWYIGFLLYSCQSKYSQ